MITITTLNYCLRRFSAIHCKAWDDTADLSFALFTQHASCQHFISLCQESSVCGFLYRGIFFVCVFIFSPFLLYLFTMNWTCCVSYGFHNAVLHSSSWHRLCLTAASALSLTLFLLSFLSLAHPLIMQSQQKAALSLGFPDTE